jgi:hypothetical protein
MIKRKKPKQKKDKLNPNDYEGYQYGPLILERYGKYVKISSDWQPQEHKEYLENIKSNQPKFKSDIDNKIQDYQKPQSFGITGSISS